MHYDAPTIANFSENVKSFPLDFQGNFIDATPPRRSPVPATIGRAAAPVPRDVA